MRVVIYQDAESLTALRVEDVVQHRAAGLLPVDARLLHEIEAPTWADAMTVYHQRMGWEPYVPEVPYG